MKKKMVVASARLLEMPESPNKNPTTDPFHRTLRLGIIILVVSGGIVLALIAILIWAGGY